MAKIAYINPDVCDGAPTCPAKRSCPAKAISQSGGSFFGGKLTEVDKSKCTGCGLCVRYCPHGAISMVNKA